MMQQDPCQACRRRAAGSPSCGQKLTEYIANQGGRVTRERLDLLHTICKLGSHFTLREIQSALEAAGSNMAMTTVYRNLPELERAGIVQRATSVEEAGNRAATWEHVWGRPHHDHLVCRGCGKKVEFVYDALEVLQNEVARTHGFRLISHTLELVGLCAECDLVPNAPARPAPVAERPLTELRKGAAARISTLGGEAGITRRLQSLGLHVGMRIRFVRAAPFSGPLLVEDVSSGARVMIARDLAAGIGVRDDDSAR